MRWECKDRTFLLVEWREDTVVLADLEVDLLLNPVRDRPLRNDDTHTWEQ